MIPKVPIRSGMALLNAQIAQSFDIRTLFYQKWKNPPDENQVDTTLRAFDQWKKNSLLVLKNIFEDNEPVSRFINTPISVIEPHLMPPKVGDAFVHFLYKISVINEIYRDLAKQAVTPLHFVESQSLIRHFDQICPIGPGTFQFSLVKYMFGNHDFEELVDVDTVFEAITGNENQKHNPKDVHGWGEEANKKTRKAFRFPIFKLSKGKIALTYPQPPSRLPTKT